MGKSLREPGRSEGTGEEEKGRDKTTRRKE